MSLDLLYPEGKTVMVAGEAVTVKKFMFPQFAKAAKLSKPIMVGLFGSGLFKVTAATEDKGVSVEFSDTWPLLILDVMAECGDDILAFCSFATGKPPEFFDNADGEEGLNLARAIFEVNWDFIKARILPSLGVKAEAVPSGTGSTLLTPSPQQDTQEVISTK